MCRVAVRQPQRPLPAGVAPQLGLAQPAEPAGEPAKYEEALNFQELFDAGAGELELDAETGDLLAMFGAPETDTVLGQPVADESVFVTQAATLAAVPEMQALQMGALLQQQGYVQVVQAPPIQAYQQALMQQQAAMFAAAAPMRNKRGKSMDEVEEQQERIKKRRRESAQRSRARKNCYMHSLEVENEALKAENDRLRRSLLAQGGHHAASDSGSKRDTPAPPTCFHSDTSDNNACSDAGLSDGGLCPQVAAGLAL